MTDPRTTTIQFKLTDRQNKLVALHSQRMVQLDAEIKHAQDEERRAKELFEAKATIVRVGQTAFQLEQDARDQFLRYLAFENLEGLTDQDNFTWRQEPENSGQFIIEFTCSQPEPKE